MTDDALVETIVAKFGREKALHAWRVTVVGDVSTGYRVQVETLCGRVFNDTAKKVSGFVTCPACRSCRDPEEAF